MLFRIFICVSTVFVLASVAFFSPSATTQETNPFDGETLYLNTANNPARKTADEWYSSGRTADAQQLEKIAKTPVSKWFGSTSGLSDYLSRARSAGHLPVLTLYAIPYRDCGSYSAGGLPASEYSTFIDEVAAGIGTTKAVVVLEPDALAGMDCLSSSLQQERLDLLKYAVTKLKSNPSTYVYMDAGNSKWHPASTMIDRLNRAGIDKADGFSLNVSGFGTTSDHITYGKEISAGVYGKHFVIDTSRNGNGSYTGGTHSGDCPSWANPPGRALGERAGYEKPSDSAVDAYLWVKYPGESDADCGGYPPAGSWMPEYARELAKNAKWTLPSDDTTAPTVRSTSPTNYAYSVARDTSVTATFSEEMDPETLTTSTVTLVQYGTTTPISATVSYDEASKKVTLKPSASLAPYTYYTATVKGGTGGAKDKAGNPLAANKVWYFYTGS